MKTRIKKVFLLGILAVLFAGCGQESPQVPIEEAPIEEEVQTAPNTEEKIVFVGFPNWWADMPMAVYQFLESYDFSGKTIIPFATSAGSGFSRTIEAIENLLPQAVVESNGLHLPMRQVDTSEDTIQEWLVELGIVAAGDVR